MLGKPDKAKEVAPDLPPFPWALDRLWDLFLEASLGIGSGGMGPPVITWQDVEAFDRASDHALSPWEKRAIVRLGSLRAAILSEDKPKKPTPAASASPGRKGKPRHGG